MSQNNENNLISIDDVISRAKSLGVDFGKGDPRERLRYLTKIGLLPHAKRKSFNGNPPNGAYPVEVISILIEIDKKIKEGKSIQAIKRELAEKKEIPPEKISPTFSPIPLYEPFKEEKAEEILLIEEKPRILKKNFLVKILGTVLLLSIFITTIFALDSWLNNKKIFSFFLASLQPYFKLTQETSPTPAVERPKFLPEISYQPYLTINAETDINAPLNIKERVTTPELILTKEGFKGSLTVATLSADQNYVFPDSSGTICLTTGNCVGLGGEIVGVGGLPNRVTKFISATRVGPSSISDFYSGIAMTIDASGRIGIGTMTPRAKLEVVGDFLTPNIFVSGATDGKVGIKITNPQYDLHVKGRIQATGDICTDMAGGKCLSQLTAGPAFWGGGGVSGSGSTGYLPIWTGTTGLGNSIVSQSGTTLDVAGTLKVTGFQLPTNAASGYILTSDASGFGTWQPAPSGTIPSGTAGQTLRHDGSSWIADSFLYNTGSQIGIGTTSILATLTLAGDAFFQGPLTISTSTFPQLVLKYDDSNKFEISVSSTGAVTLDSSSGKIWLGSGDVIYTSGGHPIRKKGEEILRTVIPIFLYGVPSQTASTSFVQISKYISDNSELSLPSPFEGTTRVYHFIIKYADDIPTTSSSTWRVVNQSKTTTYDTFYLPGKDMTNLEQGIPYFTGKINIPDQDWQLEVSAPSGHEIRVFNIFLSVFDEVN